MAIFMESWLADLLVLLCTIVSIIYVTFTIQYGYWRRKGVFYLTPTFPLGNVWQSSLFKKNSSVEFQEIYEKSKGHKMIGFFMLNKPALILRDTELLRHVLIKDFNNFTDRGFYFDEENDHISAHLFFLGGNKWRALRKKMSPTFTSGKIKNMFSILTENGGVLREVLGAAAKDKDEIEVREFSARYGTDVIASAAFGIDVNCQRNPDAEFRQWGRRFFTPTVRSFIVTSMSFMFPGLRSLINIPFVERDISNYFTRVVEETVEYREKNNVIKNDFIHLMIQLKNKGYLDDDIQETNGIDAGSKKLTLKEIAAQAFVFFLAGFETTSTAISFCLYELAKNQSIQNRLRKELDEMLAANGGKITFESLGELPYLDMVVSETLRKYPSLPLLNREVVKDYTLPGTDITLEKGTAIVVPLLGFHHDPQYYPDPEKFDPDRFTAENKRNRDSMVYMPFGDGPRNCIGARFGLLQVKTAIASLIPHMIFETSKSTPKEIVYDPHIIVLTPVTGIPLKVSARK